MKLTTGKYIGEKIIGFVYIELYDCSCIGLVFWSWGVFLRFNDSGEYGV